MSKTYRMKRSGMIMLVMLITCIVLCSCSFPVTTLLQQFGIGITILAGCWVIIAKAARMDDLPRSGRVPALLAIASTVSGGIVGENISGTAWKYCDNPYYLQALFAALCAIIGFLLCMVVIAAIASVSDALEDRRRRRMRAAIRK